MQSQRFYWERPLRRSAILSLSIAGLGACASHSGIGPSATAPNRSYADSLAVLQALGTALRQDARTVIQRFACYDGIHPCRTPAAVLPDPLLAAFAEHADAQLMNDDRVNIPPCPWGWDNPPARQGYQMGVARLTLRGDTARVLVLKHCDNPPGSLHDIFGRDDEYTLVRGADGSWAVRAERMTRITSRLARPDRKARGPG